ncbi:hypothetical protein R3P38DRAFT_3007720 [Favolaschia claudopus]|uniref:Secreted protein n=1 Tax=Favolaschia claudopus TaxID=2862362 RepID=A0AAW0AK40_9AGAR
MGDGGGTVSRGVVVTCLTFLITWCIGQQRNTVTSIYVPSSRARLPPPSGNPMLLVETGVVCIPTLMKLGEQFRLGETSLFATS